MNNQIILCLMQLKGISRKTIRKMLPALLDTACDGLSVKGVLESATRDLSRILQFTNSDIQRAIDESNRIIENCQKLDLSIITCLDDEYPQLLRESTDYPALLYCKGDISYLKHMHSVAIIGTRNPSDYGYKVGVKLGESFAKRGFVDVSGLAIGCDTSGHRGCLDANGKTIAVLAGGLDKIYPACNAGLAEEIVAKGGALLSEYPPYSTTYKAAFVERDRIQAGLSNGVFVVETKETGGTWHAVRFAGEYGRPVGVFKHPDKYAQISEAAGNRKMLQEGTALAVRNDDELESFCEVLRRQGNSGIMDEYYQLSMNDLV